MSLRCEMGLLWCTAPVAGQCIYCGASFCARHGDPEREVCRDCFSKYLEHEREGELSYVEVERRNVAEERNRQGMCGMPRCSGHAVSTCHRCQRQYCADHITKFKYSYHYRTRKGRYKAHDYVTLCDTCADHLDEYKAERFAPTIPG